MNNMPQNIQRLPGPTGASALLDARRPHTPEEAARQFEELLLRQFVQVMTRNLFRESLTGDEAPGWLSTYRDTQRDALTNVLARHLAEQGRLGIAELLLRQWQQSGYLPPADNEPESNP